MNGKQADIGWKKKKETVYFIIIYIKDNPLTGLKTSATIRNWPISVSAWKYISQTTNNLLKSRSYKCPVFSVKT